MKLRLNEQKHIYNTILSYIQDKANKGKLTSTLIELCGVLPGYSQQEIKDAMRCLHQDGIVRGGLTINKIPLIRYEITEADNLWAATKQK